MKLILPIMLCMPLLGGCDAVSDFVEPTINPAEQARLDVLEQRNGELQVELAASRDMAIAALESKNLAALDAAAVRLESALAEQLKVSEEGLAIVAQAQSKMGTVMGWAAKLPGPWQPLIPFASTIIAMLAGRRSRKWAWLTVRNSLSVGLLETMRNTGRALGMVHSSPASEEAAITGPGGYPGPGDTVPPNLT